MFARRQPRLASVECCTPSLVWFPLRQSRHLFLTKRRQKQIHLLRLLICFPNQLKCTWCHQFYLTSRLCLCIQHAYRWTFLLVASYWQCRIFDGNHRRWQTTKYCLNGWKQSEWLLNWSCQTWQSSQGQMSSWCKFACLMLNKEAALLRRTPTFSSFLFQMYGTDEVHHA